MNIYEYAKGMREAEADPTIAALEKRIGELEAERDDALREHTDMMWQRRRAEEEAATERQRREDAEGALRLWMLDEVQDARAEKATAAYFARYEGKL